MKRSIIALIMALAMILTLVACGNSNGDNNNGGNDVKAIQLSLGHTNNTDHHYQVLAESFKKIVEEKSNGQLIINIFPAEQLGSGSEMLESVKSGTQDMVWIPMLTSPTMIRCSMLSLCPMCSLPGIMFSPSLIAM